MKAATKENHRATGRLRDILPLVLREALGKPQLPRLPEPAGVMSARESVASFHAQGAGALLPVYHFCAAAVDRLLPRGGTLLDLGCGSGQFLRFLARRRPDVKLIGLELSGEMVRLGRRANAEEGRTGRVELRRGDMTKFNKYVPEHVDVVCCIYALHHLPSAEDVRRLFTEACAARRRCGCAVWTFDHARPRHPRTAERFPEVFTPDASEEFRRDSRNSLRASFSFAELSSLVDEAGPAGFRHVRSRLLPLFQVHWLEGEEDAAARGPRPWTPAAISPAVQKEFRKLRLILRRVPPAAEAERRRPLESRRVRRQSDHGAEGNSFGNRGSSETSAVVTVTGTRNS